MPPNHRWHAPGERAVQTSEHLARLSMGILIRATLVARRPPLTLRKIGNGVRGRAPQLIGEVTVVLVTCSTIGRSLWMSSRATSYAISMVVFSGGSWVGSVPPPRAIGSPKVFRGTEQDGDRHRPVSG